MSELKAVRVYNTMIMTGEVTREDFIVGDVETWNAECELDNRRYQNSAHASIERFVRLRSEVLVVLSEVYDLRRRLGQYDKLEVYKKVFHKEFKADLRRLRTQKSIDKRCAVANGELQVYRAHGFVKDFFKWFDEAVADVNEVITEVNARNMERVVEELPKNPLIYKDCEPLQVQMELFEEAKTRLKGIAITIQLLRQDEFHRMAREEWKEDPEGWPQFVLDELIKQTSGKEKLSRFTLAGPLGHLA